MFIAASEAPAMISESNFPGTSGKIPGLVPWIKEASLLRREDRRDTEE
jgi:hypothetical protein